MGNPYVSYNLNAISPEKDSEEDKSKIDFSNNPMPLSKVSLNLVSSFLRVEIINALALLSSGKASPILCSKQSTSFQKCVS